MGDTEIEQVTEVKLLGITVDSQMSLNSQVDRIVQRMGRGMGMIKHCRKFMPNRLFKQVVQALVHLDYGSVIWSSTTAGNLSELPVAQNKAACLVP